MRGSWPHYVPPTCPRTHVRGIRWGANTSLSTIGVLLSEFKGIRVLVTGSAGFIGFHLARQLLELGARVTGIDALTDYYDVALKTERLRQLESHPRYRHFTSRLEDSDAIVSAVQGSNPQVVVHLAAQAGVRYALEEPRSYLESNIVGSFNILEAVRQYPVDHLLIASTSSVYGSNADVPYAETQRTDHPLSFYAATKKAVEDLSHSYSHLHGIPTTMFRFFTVYGSWGRPDMALFKFVEAARTGGTIRLHDEGRMLRDFTHVTDLVAAITRLISAVPETGRPVCPVDSVAPNAPYRTVNIGGGTPMPVLRFVEAIERATQRPLRAELVKSVPGEVPVTHADPALLVALTGFMPTIDIDTGIQEFVQWYDQFYPSDATVRD